LSLTAIALSSQVYADNLRPEGTLSIVAQNDSLLVSWIIDGSVFSGIASLNGTTNNVSLTEISLASQDQFLNTTGGGTGSNISTTGGGTGSKSQHNWWRYRN